METKIFIKNLRKRLNLTQIEFARLLGVTNQTVSNWENGGVVNPPMMERLRELEKENGTIKNICKNPSQPTTTYLVPYYANAGQNEGGLQGITANELERVVSPVCGAEYCITIHGESMQPTYPSGCRVFIKRIVANFVPGNTYIIDTADGIMLKRLSYSDNPDRLLCASINPDVLYKPFEMDKSNIFGIYRVLGIFIPINE